jgi:hypothetical protein
MSYAELIAEAKAGYPVSWIPKKDKDDVLAGKLVKVDKGTTSFGPCKIAVLETEDGTKRSVWLLHEALISQFKSASPAIGDGVAIVYLGVVKSKTEGHSDYHSYRVVSDGVSEGTVDWASDDIAPTSDTPTDDDIPF